MSGPAMTPAVRAEIVQAIRDHRLNNNPVDWSVVKAMWPDLLVGDKNSAAHKRFSRLEREARDAGTAPADQRADAVRKAKSATKKHLPSPPMPTTLLSNGKKADEAMNVMAVLNRLLADVEKVRATSVKVDDEGEEKIKNAALFDKTIGRRIELIETYLAIFREVYDLQQMRRFYEAITEIIVQEIHPLHPEVSGRIIERLRELNDHNLMTPYADPS